MALDSTSISSYANKLPNVERGRNKDEDNLPQINLLMLVESKSGLPIFYRTYDGNVPDVQTVRRVIADNSRLGIQNVVLVSDRGYSGTKNINDCLRNKVGFLFNMKCGISGSLTQELIDEERLNLQDLNRRDWYTQVFQVTKKINWIYEPSPVKNQRSTKKTQESAELYWHIYFDRQIAENARQGLFERIDRVREKLANGKALDENEQTLLEEVFEKHEQDDAVSYSVDNKKVDQKLRYKGYRVLVSDEISDAGKAWCAYQERWIVEDTFKTLKSRLGCSRNRVSDNESLTGKTFVQFLATSIAMIVRTRLRKYSEECKKNSALADGLRRRLQSSGLLEQCDADQDSAEAITSERSPGKEGSYLKLSGFLFLTLSRKRNRITMTKKKQNSREAALKFRGRPLLDTLTSAIFQISGRYPNFCNISEVKTLRLKNRVGSR